MHRASHLQKIFVFQVSQPASYFSPAGSEGVSNVFDKDQPKHQVLVFGGVHVGAKLVGCGSKCFFDVAGHEWVQC